MRFQKVSIIIILGLFLVPTFSALAVSPTEDKPDLIIYSSGFAKVGDTQSKTVAYASIKNVGNVTVDDKIYVSYIIRRIPSLRIVSSGSCFVIRLGGLLPGDWTSLDLVDTMDLPRFGIYRLTVEVNPEKTIEESNYDNNKAASTHFAFFGIWV